MGYMCGRYNLELRDDFKTRFHISNKLPEMKSRYNIAPSQRLPVVVSHSPNRVELMQWGLIPFWSRDGRGGVINARAETVAEKPMFKRLLTLQRCLVPATGFYEWKHESGGKVPHHIFLKDHEYFAFAGLYDTWEAPNGETRSTYTIITTTPNALMEPIHNRMPVILRREDEDRWLNPDEVEAEPLLKRLQPYPADAMECYEISTNVNNPSHDDKRLLHPV